MRVTCVTFLNCLLRHSQGVDFPPPQQQAPIQQGSLSHGDHGEKNILGSFHPGKKAQSM